MKSESRCCSCIYNFCLLVSQTLCVSETASQRDEMEAEATENTSGRRNTRGSREVFQRIAGKGSIRTCIRKSPGFFETRFGGWGSAVHSAAGLPGAPRAALGSPRWFSSLGTRPPGTGTGNWARLAGEVPVSGLRGTCPLVFGIIRRRHTTRTVGPPTGYGTQVPHVLGLYSYRSHLLCPQVFNKVRAREDNADVSG